MTTSMNPQQAADAAEPQDQAADIFISYSRADGAFVRRLQEALVARGVRPWVDWSDIPPSAEWMTEIRQAIDGADTFVMVLSPDSVGSRVCSVEVSIAAEGHKRVIPLLRRDIERGSAEDAVSKLNWIFFRNEDDFDTGMDKLIEAIETDLEDVHVHTRLLGRAREWETGGRDASQLVRGKELDGFERWLSSRKENSISATRLQTEFLIASRRQSSRRQRGAISVVTIAFLLAATFGVVAVEQRNAARAAQDRAETQSRIARSRELATSALRTLPTDPELSLMLAVQAEEAAPTAQAEDALREALPASRVRMTLHHAAPGTPTLQQWVSEVTISPDGKLIASGGADGQVVVWNATTGAMLYRLDTPGHLPVDRLAFGANHTLLAHASKGIGNGHERGVALVWDTTTGSAEIAAPDQRMDIARLHISKHRLVDEDLFDWEPQLSPDGSLLATTTDRTAVLRNIATGEAVHRLHQPGNILATAFSPDGSQYATAGQDGTVGLWSTSNGRRIASLRPPWQAQWQGAPSVNAVAFSADGKTLATATHDISFWDTNSWRLHRSIPGGESPSDAVGGLLLSPDGARVAINEGTGSAFLIRDATTGKVMTKVPYSTEALAVAPNWASLAWTPNADTKATVSDGFSTIATLQQSDHVITALALSTDGTKAITGDEAGVVKVWEAGDGGTSIDVSDVDPGAANQGLAPALAGFSPDGTRMLLTVPDGTAQIRDTQSGDAVAVLHAAHCDPDVYCPVWASFSPDGSKVLTTASIDGAVQIWDATTGASIALVAGKADGDFASATFDGTGTLVAVADRADGQRPDRVPGGSRSVTIYDGATGASVRTIPVGKGRIWDLAFAPSGSNLLTASGSETAARVKLWDSSTGDLVVERPPSRYPFADIFTPDGSKVVTTHEGNGDGIAQVWDAVTGAGISSVPVTYYRAGVDISPDGRYALTTNADAGMVWDIATGKQISVYHGGGDSLTAPHFSPDGRFAVAVEGYGYFVHVWDAATGTRVLRLGNFSGFDANEGASFTPDGQRVMVGGYAGNVQVWQCDSCGTPAQLLDLGPSRLTRDFTDEERSTYLSDAP